MILKLIGCTVAVILSSLSFFFFFYIMVDRTIVYLVDVVDLA